MSENAKYVICSLANDIEEQIERIGDPEHWWYEESFGCSVLSYCGKSLKEKPDGLRYDEKENDRRHHNAHWLANTLDCIASVES